MSNYLQRLAPYLSGAGNTLINLDADEVGPDDLIGHLLIFSGDVIVAAQTGGELPPLPEALTAPISGRISNETRIAFLLASGGLATAQIQLAYTKPRFSMALRFATQAINAILAGRAVPTLPTL